MSNKIEDLRNRLFETLERLNDPKNDIAEEIKRAAQTVEVSKTIIEIGRLEIEFLKAGGQAQGEISFFEASEDIKSIPEKAKN